MGPEPRTDKITITMDRKEGKSHNNIICISETISLLYTVLETNYRTDPDRKSHIKSVEQKLPVQKDCDGGDSGCTGQPDQDNVEVKTVMFFLCIGER